MTNQKLFWELQENIIDSKSKMALSDFVTSSDRYTQFTKVKEFEQAWSKWQGCKYSVFVNSGSSAILVIFSALKDIHNWDDQSEILVPAVTWITDISVLLQLGLKPVFVDVNLDDFSFDYKDLESKITKNTKAIFLTHLLGFPADILKVKNIIGKRRILLIEDCCESHGAKVGRVKVGNFGIASLFSFYWGHHITTIEGGMICTNNEKLYLQALLKRSHGLARELPKKYHQFYKDRYPDVDFNFLFLTDGFNVRNTELNAVLGLSQLGKLDKFIEIRNHNFARFNKIISKYPDHLYASKSASISSFALPFISKKSMIRKRLQLHLNSCGIETRPFISGNLLKQPFLKQKFRNIGFSNADLLHRNGFYIGNNQFVDEKRLGKLDQILYSFFQNQ